MYLKQEVDATVQALLAYLWTYGPSKQWPLHFMFRWTCMSI